jgi:DNA-directed RNA polymerase alpha subunit
MNNVFISCKESRIEHNRSFYGCFSLGAFDAAQSLTVANALRRTLLSECPGLGIISVTIENVSHEYGTLPGMRESVLDLLLNLKEIVFCAPAVPSLYPDSIRRSSLSFEESPSLRKGRAEGGSMATLPIRGRAERAPSFRSSPNGESSHRGVSSKEREEKAVCSLGKQSNPDDAQLNMTFGIYSNSKKPVAGYLKVKGPGVVRARDLRLPPFIQCVDPDQYIATLAADGFLGLKFMIMAGKGYLIQKNNSMLQYTSPSLPIAKPSSPFSPLEREEQGKAKPFSKGKGEKEQEQGNLTYTSTLQAGANRRADLIFKGKRAQESKPLNLDCIFNPVTKVSYVIEDFDNKVINDFNQDSNFVNDVSSLIESSHYLKKNLPFLQFAAPSVPLLLSPSMASERSSKFVETVGKYEMQQLSGYLHPLKKQNSLHNIVLEIWTNGSLHPREALWLGFQNLGSVFLNLQKTKIFY